MRDLGYNIPIPTSHCLRATEVRGKAQALIPFPVQAQRAPVARESPQAKATAACRWNTQGTCTGMVSAEGMRDTDSVSYKSLSWTLQGKETSKQVMNKILLNKWKYYEESKIQGVLLAMDGGGLVRTR